MSKLVPPHGGDALKPALVTQAERAEALKRAATLKPLRITSRECSDLVMLAMGAYTPLAGFMGHDDWRSVCTDMKCADGLFWPIPITLSCDEDTAASLAASDAARHPLQGSVHGAS